MSRQNFGDTDPYRENTGSGTKKKPLISVSDAIWLVGGLVLGAVAQTSHYAIQEYRASSKGK